MDHITEICGTRVCHDLISPVSAILLGSEALELYPNDLELLKTIKESAIKASSRLAMFRAIFTDVNAKPTFNKEEFLKIASEYLNSEGITLRINMTQNVIPSSLAKLFFYSCIISKSILIKGGSFTAEIENKIKCIIKGPQINPSAVFSNEINHKSIFYYLTETLAKSLGTSINIKNSETFITIEFF